MGDKNSATGTADAACAVLSVLGGGYVFFVDSQTGSLSRPSGVASQLETLSRDYSSQFSPALLDLSADLAFAGVRQPEVE